jgi:superfamily I DNA/RNA helicase
VDEYQDTNKLQAEIVDLLAVKHRNVMVVGDDAQSIFAFRGASVEGIYEFPKRYPEARTSGSKPTTARLQRYSPSRTSPSRRTDASSRRRCAPRDLRSA